MTKRAATPPAETASWYTIRNAADDPRHAELEIYSQVGESFWFDSVSAKDFVRELSDLDVDTLDVRINSPGGSVFDGVAIYNSLRRHPAEVTVYVDGWAASIASIIMLAGDRVVIGEGAMVMIHNPSIIAWGEAADLRKEADTLDQLRAEIIDIYTKRTTSTPEDIGAWMDAETWMNGATAVERGFADEVATDLPDATATAKFDPVIVAHLAQRAPAAIAARLRATASTEAPAPTAPEPVSVDVPAETSTPEIVVETAPEHAARMHRLLATR